MKKRTTNKRTTKITITLTIDHGHDVDPHELVDKILDNGTLQDALVEYAADMLGETVEVTNTECEAL